MSTPIVVAESSLIGREQSIRSLVQGERGNATTHSVVSIFTWASRNSLGREESKKLSQQSLREGQLNLAFTARNHFIA